MKCETFWTKTVSQGQSILRAADSSPSVGEIPFPAQFC